MTDAKLLSALEQMKVETGSLVCLGCGHEHDCSTQGCAIIRQAEQRIRELTETVRVASLVMQAAGLCRFDDFTKCRHYMPEETDCEKCIERWLKSRAKKNLEGK